MNLPVPLRLHGIVPAAHTPFHPDGSLNLAAVEDLAAHFLRLNVPAVFIGGTTGECSSLTVEERRALAQRWFEVVCGSKLRIVVHVGSNCVADSRTLAAQAQQQGAAAIAALAPSYFKPRGITELVGCCAEIAAAAPETPFYHYDIPSFTGLSLSMPEFLEQARDRIPTLAGLKFTNSDLLSYQLCLRADGGAWDVPFGLDEHVLGALAMGARGAVGSGYNFAAPIYLRLIAAFERGDMRAAREEQFRGVRLIQTFVRYGYMAAAKATTSMLGVNVGPPRLPLNRLTTEETANLRSDLEALGFFDWVKAG